MLVKRIKLWPGHSCVVIVVKRWLPAYRLFNLCFARAAFPTELIITDNEQLLWGGAHLDG